MAEFLTKYRVMCGTIETTPGTAETLADADFDVRVLEPSLTINVEMDMSPTKYSTGDFGLGESIPGPTSANCSFMVKGVNNPNATDEPNFGKFLQGCGLGVDTYSGEAWGSGVVYYADSDYTEKSLTLGMYDIERGATPSGLRYLFSGAMGNCTISAEGTGKPYMFNFEYTGALDGVSDIAKADIPVLTSPQTDIPDRFLNGSGTIGGVEVCISTLELNLNNTISPVQCQSSSTGYSKFGLTDQAPTLTINPLLTRETDYDFYSKLTGGTVEEVIIQTEQFRIQVPRAQIQTASVEDADGILRTPITFSCLRPSSSHATTGYSPIRIYTRN